MKLRLSFHCACRKTPLPPPVGFRGTGMSKQERRQLFEAQVKAEDAMRQQEQEMAAAAAEQQLQQEQIYAALLQQQAPLYPPPDPTPLPGQVVTVAATGGQMLVQPDGSLVPVTLEPPRSLQPQPFVDAQSLIFPNQAPPAQQPTFPPPAVAQPFVPGAPPPQYLPAQPKQPVVSTVQYYAPASQVILQPQQVLATTQAPETLFAPPPNPSLVELAQVTTSTATRASRDPREPPPPPPSPPKPKAPRLPPNWRTAKDSEGKTYYYHSVTR